MNILQQLNRYYKDISLLIHRDLHTFNLKQCNLDYKSKYRYDDMFRGGGALYQWGSGFPAFNYRHLHKYIMTRVIQTPNIRTCIGKYWQTYKNIPKRYVVTSGQL